MLKGYLRSPVAPWSGLIAGPIAWLINHQGVGDAIYFNCKAGNPVTSGIVGLLSLLILAGGGYLSWSARHGGSPPNPEPQTRFFLSIVSLLLCGLFAVTVVLQTLAGFILPGCYG